MRRQVIEWPMKGSGKWWIVENRGTAEDPLYTPIAQRRTRAEALALLDDTVTRVDAAYDRLHGRSEQ